VLEELKYVGVLCLEFFVETDGERSSTRSASSAQFRTISLLTLQSQVSSSSSPRHLRAAAWIDRPVVASRRDGKSARELWEDGEPNWAAASRSVT